MAKRPTLTMRARVFALQKALRAVQKLLRYAIVDTTKLSDRVQTLEEWRWSQKKG